MIRSTKFSSLSAIHVLLFFLLSTSSYSLGATVTWDPDNDQVSNGGAGTWDTVTTNWDDDGSAPNVTWTNGDDANFGDSGAAYVVNVADGGVTVKDLTVSSGTGKVTFASVTDNLGRITVASGGATWDTGGRELEFLNNTLNDTPLSISSGDTLTVIGTGGQFDTGEKPNGANWGATGATLDFQAGTLRGNNGSVGQFGTVIMADGSNYIHERNADQGYANNWQLNGDVSFDNRHTRSIVLNGVVSGSGTMTVSGMNGKFVRFNSSSNTFSGGLVIDSTASRSEVFVPNGVGDGAFGAVPGSFDPDNIRLVKNGELKMQAVTINANRGITLEDGGIIVNTGAPNSYGGTITGTGGLQVGRDAGNDGNTLILTSDTNDYTGGTTIYQGRIQLGIADALPNDTVLSIGGKGTSQFLTNGFNQEIGGLQSVASNTRVVVQTSPNDSTLTINVAAGESYNYGANLTDAGGAGVLNIVKNGPGTQLFNRPGAWTRFDGTVDVNDGLMEVTANGFTANGAPSNTTVDGGTLAIKDGYDGPVSVTGGTLSPGVTSTPVGTATLSNTLALTSGSTLAFDLLGTDQTVGGGINDLIDTVTDLTLDGTLNLTEIVTDSFLSAMVGDEWRLINYSGSLTDNGLDVGSLPTPAGYMFAIDTTTAGEVNLVLTAVPEPSSALLLSVSLLLLVRLRRNKA